MELTISEKITLLRKQKGLTLEEVGNYVGVSKSTVQRWESGNIRTMKIDKVEKLADILGTTPSYLLGEVEDTESKSLPTDEEIKMALFGGSGEVTDAMWEEALEVIEFIKHKHAKDLDGHHKK